MACESLSNGCDVAKTLLVFDVGASEGSSAKVQELCSGSILFMHTLTVELFEMMFACEVCYRQRSLLHTDKYSNYESTREVKWSRDLTTTSSNPQNLKQRVVTMFLLRH